MFMLFAFGARILSLVGISAEGFDYITWAVLSIILVGVNFYYLKNKLIIKKRYILLLSILFLLVILNYFFVKINSLIYFMGAFFTFQFVYNFILFYNLKFNFEWLIATFKAIIFILSLLMISMYVERLLFYDYNQFVGLYGYFSLRGIETLAKNAAIATTLLNINIILSLIIFYFTGGKKYLLIAIISFITVALSLFLKTIITSLLISVLFFWFFVNKKYRARVLYVLVFLSLVGFFLGGKNIIQKSNEYWNMYVNESGGKMARIELYKASIKIATDYFPFGCGQGTFGSYPVRKYYSNVYYQYHLDKIYGLQPTAKVSNNDFFLFDTFWSHIIGELGFIGTILYLLLWLHPFLKAKKFLHSDDRYKKILSFFIVSVTVVIFIESFAISIPEQLQFIIIYAGLGAMAYKLLFQEIKYQEAV